MRNSPKSLSRKAFGSVTKLTGLGIICAAVLFGGAAFAGNTTYQYDALGRVIKVTYPDSKQICYAYDSAGNRTQVKRQATSTCTVTGSTLTSSSLVATTSSAEAMSVLDSSTTTTPTTDQTATDSVTTSTTDDSAATN